MKKLNIHVLLEGDIEGKEPHACSYIRLILPFKYLTDKVMVTFGPNYTDTKADIIIGERVFIPSLIQTRSFLRYIKGNNICFIYTIDDNLLDLPGTYKTPEFREIIKLLSVHANGIIVSRNNLGRRFLDINPRVYTFPNSLDIQTTGLREIFPNSGDIKIGYMGTITHHGDFSMVQPAINYILQKYDNVSFELLGVTETPAAIKLPRFKYHQAIYNYPNFWKWVQKNIFWDIGIAPLTKSIFASGKSAVKYTDYAAMGIVGVYSNVPAYDEIILHRQTGLLVNNTTSDWIAALEELIINSEFRTKMAENSQKWLLNNRVLQYTVSELLDTISHIYNSTTTNTKVMETKDSIVDIIIPIFNAYNDFLLCFQSILKNTDLSKHTLVLVNDNSSDENINLFLEKLSKVVGKNIIILNSKETKGFIKSVNRGMQINPSHDVVLLNSDTIVTKNWIRKLKTAAYSKENIASVTPFSNNATICSLPEFLKSNDLPIDKVAAFAKMVERLSLYLYPEIPTAVGFCMYIRRNILNKVGLFNEDFGMGYGEENDFCRRAVSLGYMNILCDDLFIYHKGGSSFQSEDRTRLQEENTKLLLKLHPNYNLVVQKFIQKNPAQYYQTAIKEIIKEGLF